MGITLPPTGSPIGSKREEGVVTANPRKIPLQKQSDKTVKQDIDRQNALLEVGQDVISYTEKALHKGTQNRDDSTPEG